MRTLAWFLAALVFGLAAWFIYPVLEPYAMRWWSASQALRIQEGAAQVRNAAQLYRLQHNTDLLARTDLSVLKEQGFLKKVPVNPVLGRGGGPFQVVFSGDVRQRMVPADTILADLGQNRLLCEQLIDRMGDAVPVPRMGLMMGPNIALVMRGRDEGCFRTADRFPWGTIRPATYVYFRRI